jgi:hypothetical protein
MTGKLRPALRLGSPRQSRFWLGCLGFFASSCSCCQVEHDFEVPVGLPVQERRLYGGVPGKDPRVVNGWFVQDGQLIWGFALHNGWWAGLRKGDGWWATAGVRPNITRRAPGRVGPTLTEDLDQLTDAMVAFGYPGFEHNFGLWYDRRRDAHDVVRRTDPHAVGPYLEQPWARSNRGIAWDGLPLYDLEEFNPWYFERLRAFAELCDKKGAVFVVNFYMQHALLERQTHYVDFPWRPANSLQDTGLPDEIPAANAFYDIEHPVRRRLHRLYIRKVLDELGGSRNVVLLPGMEYTGPIEFVRFWLDVVSEWEVEHERQLLVGVGAPKDVLDGVLEDPVRGPRVAVIDLRYWFFRPDGELYAPEGGKEVAGRYAGGGQSRRASPDQIYRQVVAYRRSFPKRAILHTIAGDRRQSLAFLMAGGSLLVRQMSHPQTSNIEPWLPPTEYVAPVESHIILPVYRVLRQRLATIWPGLRPAPERILESDRTAWALADEGDNIVVYALEGGRLEVELGSRGAWRARWLDPRTGATEELPLEGDVGPALRVETPDEDDWLLWVSASGPSSDVVSPLP